jgi:hypothetical protein
VVFRVSAGSDLCMAPQDLRRRAAVSQVCMLTFPVPPSPTRTSLKVGFSAMLEFVLTRSALVCCLDNLGVFRRKLGYRLWCYNWEQRKRWLLVVDVGKKSFST